MASDLPTREANLFKQLLQQYEHKQYKKGIKSADQILKKFPEHGETLSMKGLLFNCLEKKEEAYDFVRRGLKNNLKSHICWHVFGLLHRSDKNYEEAIKCYRNALRHDKDNMQILRDLSLLQVQIRSYDGFIETRHQLLSIRPQQKGSWVGLVLAYYLQKNFTMAIKILEAYEDTLPEQNKNVYDFEHSEFSLFHNHILVEAGKYKEALTHLDKIQPFVYDELEVMETRAFLLLNLKQFEDAKQKYKELILYNPEDERYYFSYLKCFEIDEVNDSNRDQVFSIYESLSKELPKAMCPKRLALYVATGDNFAKKIEEYLIYWLRKGTPSLFSNIKSLYLNPEKLATIEKIVLGFYDTLKSQTKLRSEDEKLEEPTSMLWLLYYLAQLYDFKREHEKALKFINEAIEHTPTVVEVVQGRAKIFKHAGDLKKAKECMNQARELDLQDRFINTKCTKYMIRNDDVSDAESVISLFAKGDINDNKNNLIEMQCIWYVTETGFSFLRQKQYGKALKRFQQIEKYFVDFNDDQFDFHTYCMRKITLRAYVKMIHFEDDLRSHRFYFKAALGAIQCYLDLADSPAPTSATQQKDELDGLTEEERKKALSKQRKAEAKAKEGVKKETKVETQKGKKEKPVDLDPDGEKYLETQDPLGEATKFLVPLQTWKSEKMETHLMACEIYLRKKKYLLVLKALKKGYQLDPSNPSLHLLAIKFLKELNTLEGSSTLTDVLKEESEALFQGKSAETFNEEFSKAHEKSLPHALYVFKSLILLQSKDIQKRVTSILSTLDFNSKLFTLDNAIQCHRFLSSNFQPLADEFKTKCQKKFPFSTYFHGEDINSNISTSLQKEPEN